MATALDTVGQYKLDRVFNRTFSTIVDNWLVLLGFALAVGAVSAAASVYSIQGFLDAIPTDGQPANPNAVFAAFQGPGYWVGITVTLLCQAASHSGMIVAMQARKANESAGFAETFAGAIRFFLPVLGLTILWTLGVMAGWILLVVPGLILLTMWSVSLPALVIERLGVFASFGRSIDLTKGIRWPVFGTLVAFMFIYYIIAFAVQGFSSMGMIALYKSNIVLGVVAATLSSAVLSVLMTAFLFALYQEVRATQEGEGSSGLAEIFS